MLDPQGRSVGTIPLPNSEGASWLGIGFGGADQLFLAASGDGRIVVMNLKGAAVREFPAGDAGEKAGPAGILVSRGSCFVTDNRTHKVRVFSLDGRKQTSWGGLGENATQFRAPFRIVQDSLDRVLVSDAYFGSLQLFDAQGAYQGVLCDGGRPLALESPTGLAVRGHTVFVVEMAAGRVSAWEFGPH